MSYDLDRVQICDFLSALLAGRNRLYGILSLGKWKSASKVKDSIILLESALIELDREIRVDQEGDPRRKNLERARD